MGFIQEMADLLSRLKFHEIVYEYQQGLYQRNGVVQERRKKQLSTAEAQQYAEEEKEVIQTMGRRSFLPFRRVNLPAGYRRSFYTGLPLHPGRFDRILRPGLYLHVPIMDEIVTESKQERVYNLGNITVPTMEEDSRSMQVSCDLRRRDRGLLQDVHRSSRLRRIAARLYPSDSS